MTRYSHAMTLAYVVESDDPKMPTIPEQMDALRARLQQLESDPQERIEALTTSIPFDTYEIEATS